MPFDMTSLMNLGFPEIMLWLLTFAVVHGILTQVKIPDSPGARAIIAMVSGFLVLFSAPAQLIAVMSQMASSLLLVVIGLLVLIIFLEIVGLQTGKVVLEQVGTDKEGKPITKQKPASLFQAYPLLFAIILIAIAVLVFTSSGGLELLGFKGIALPTNIGSWVFLLIMIGAIGWMMMESKGKQ